MRGRRCVVRGGIGEIIGAGNVHFYDYRAGPPGGEHDYSAAAAGLKYDLADAG